MANSLGVEKQNQDFAKTQMEKDHQQLLKKIKAEHEKEIETIIQNNEKQKKDLQSGYSVQISHEANQLESQLALQRAVNEQRINEEKTDASQEIEKVRAQKRMMLANINTDGDEQSQKIEQEAKERLDSLYKRESAARQKLLGENNGIRKTNPKSG